MHLYFLESKVLAFLKSVLSNGVPRLRKRMHMVIILTIQQMIILGDLLTALVVAIIGIMMNVDA